MHDSTREELQSPPWYAKYWPIMAAIGGCLIGVYMFLAGYISELGIQSKFLLGMGKMTWIIPFVLVRYILNRRDGIWFFTKELKHKSTGKWKWNLIWVLFWIEVCTFGVTGGLQIGFQYGIRAGYNTGILSAINNVSLIVVAIGGYLIFKQSLNALQIVAIFGILGGSVILSVF